MPLTEMQVNELLSCEKAHRLDLKDERCRLWSEKLQACSTPGGTACLRVQEDLPLEYFDFVPRLRVLQEFFDQTLPTVLTHRFCDLRFDEFLENYPMAGKEAGLEISFFEPR